MTKKLILGTAALAMLFATSCQNDLDFDAAGEKSTVSFQVGTPEIASRAYSDGATATVLQYAVYDQAGEELEQLTVTDGEIHGSTTVNLQLTTGNTYSVIFWAAAEGAPYTVDFANKTMTVDYTDAVSNDETRDAFYKYHTFTVKGAQTETIELKRPFAQLNIGTADYAASTDAGYTPTHSAVTVKNIYTTLDLVGGEATGETEVVFGANAIPDSEKETFPVSGGYEYLAMNYLLVNAEKEVVDIEFTYTDGNDAKTRTVGSVPVQRNYRTNIYGNLLTSDVEVNVEIKPDYDDDNKYGVVDGQVYVKVANVDEFNAAFADENVDIIILGGDINLNEVASRATVADPSYTVAKELTIDLNGKKLSATSAATGKNYNLFYVKNGALTVKNGTIEYNHVGNNMGWNNSTNIFHVEKATLNLDGVTAKNLGGSDMAFVAHLNNWGEVTLNVENSTLESSYIAVRVFNSGNDMNNVTIKDSTLKGKFDLWVHNYTVADFGTEEKAEAHKALLNFDIFNGTNTFEYTGKAPVLYGFTDAIYFNAEGCQIVSDAKTLAQLLVSDNEDINVVLDADVNVNITSLGSQTPGSGEYKLGGENTKNITIDLNDKKLTIATTYWSAIGAKNADALFSIKNGKMTSSQESGTWNSYDLVFANCNYAIENVVFEKAVAFTNVGKETTLTNVTINETHDYYAMWISAEGQTVKIDGLTVNSAGRGIKIDEQYVDTPAKVTLNLANATFKTAKKAAVIVKSEAGAEINVENVNISNVAADTEFAVWVDEDAKAYADKVVVNGAFKKVEGE